jgi:Flp pilus assembly pilin Flp
VVPILVRIHLAVTARLRGEGGQTSAEYALVLLGAASVALLVALWAKDTDKIGTLLDTIFDSIVKLVK